MWDIRGRSGSINSRTDEGGAAAARDSEKPTTVASMDIENGTGGDEGDRVPLAPDSSSSSANPAIRSSSGDASQSRGIQNNDKTANSKCVSKQPRLLQSALAVLDNAKRSFVFMA